MGGHGGEISPHATRNPMAGKLSNMQQANRMYKEINSKVAERKKTRSKSPTE